MYNQKNHRKYMPYKLRVFIGKLRIRKQYIAKYTPLNGTGLKPVTRTLKEAGYSNIALVFK